MTVKLSFKDMFKLFNKKSKKEEINQYFNLRADSVCRIVSRAFTVGEIKEYLSKLGSDETKVLFMKDSNFIEVIIVEKGAVNKNAGQRPSENPLPSEFIECVYVKMA